MEEYGRGDVIRNVSDDNKGLADEIGETDLEHIRLYDSYPLIARVSLTQALREHAVDLDDDDSTSASQKKLRERSSSGSNLDHDVTARRACGIGNVLERGSVIEEMLTESFEDRRRRPLARQGQLRRTSSVKSSSLGAPPVCESSISNTVRKISSG